MSRKLTLIVAFLTASLSSLVFAQAPVTDGLKWDTDMPKAFGVARVSQIQLNGLVDAALYADGAVIADTISYKVYLYDVKMSARGMKVEDKTFNVAAGTSWTGSTTRAGGYPAGNYSIEITTDKFRETANATATRVAILKKEPFEIK